MQNIWYSSLGSHMGQQSRTQWGFLILRCLFPHAEASLCAILFRIVSQREAIVEIQRRIFSTQCAWDRIASFFHRFMKLPPFPGGNGGRNYGSFVSRRNVTGLYTFLIRTLGPWQAKKASFFSRSWRPNA